MGTKKRKGHEAPPGYDPSIYDRPSVACDVVIVSFQDSRLKVLLIKRKRPPYQGFWALPGGFVEIDESLETAALREVREETGVSGLSLIPLGSYGDPDRDPRTRVISAAYLALVRADKIKPRAGDDAADARWFSLSRPPELAFDHRIILRDARKRLREIAVLTPRIFELLPDAFPAEDFYNLAREVMGIDYDKPSFIKSLQRIPCFELEEEGRRPEEALFRFNRKKYREGDLAFLLFGKRPVKGK